MRYSEAIEFLGALQMFGARPGLERTWRLAEFAGQPQQALRFIHVAGTNGKGSTCAMLEAIYRAAGLRVGLYTSPHLVTFRERIQINRELIPEADVIRLTQRIRDWLPQFSKDEHPTFFEIATIMALCYFAEQKCDLVIWETGLGGRLDATNIVTPLVSVITNVQFDHEKWLGNTVAEIAREKAGIIKPNVPVITAAEDESALAVISEVARANGSELHVVKSQFALEPSWQVNLRGEHQRLNAALAAKTVEVLSSKIAVPAEAIRAGLAAVHWAARFQVLQRGEQTIVLDGAHNPAGAGALAIALREEFPNCRYTLVLGILEDKNWQEVCHTLSRDAAEVYTAPVASVRTASAESLAAACKEANPEAHVVAVNSLQQALQLTQKSALVVIAGSLYLIGEALELLGESAAVNERSLNEWSPTRRSNDPSK
jgi:dihydrofolate synthase / folylpolyglutamate synthase